MPQHQAANAMVFEVGVEDIEPNHWVAWVFAIPGCFGSGSSEEDALTTVPQAIMDDKGNRTPVIPKVVERGRATPHRDDPEFLINALFEDDRRPLQADEIEDGIARLKQNRKQFNALLADQTLCDEVVHIVRHMKTAENWYLNVLGLVPLSGRLPDDPIEQLEMVRTWLLDCLPRLAENDLYTTESGEGWTPRKLLRRAIWHERDHTRQIRSFLDGK